LQLAGANATREEQMAFSLENFVNDQTPPAFLWHTSDDDCVPVQNSLLFAAALAAHHVPFELHVYPHGAHGLSLCDERTWADNPWYINPVTAGWFALAVRWAKEI
jgi:dipeptidyl aminopeptidase/acylaminoacyl peptidase